MRRGRRRARADGWAGDFSAGEGVVAGLAVEEGDRLERLVCLYVEKVCRFVGESSGERRALGFNPVIFGRILYCGYVTSCVCSFFGGG